MTLIVCDIAGTTVNEDGIVYRELRACVERRGATVTADQVNAVKGTEKRSAITALLTAGGRGTTEEEVAETFADFMDGLRRAYAEQPPSPVAGVEDRLRAVRAAGGSIALTTGFQRDIAEVVLRACGWGVRRFSVAPGEGDVPALEATGDAGFTVDALVTSDTVPAGRPAPYLIHRAMEMAGVASVDDVVSVGDTVADLQAAANAGVRGVGVLTGSVAREVLEAQPHALVLDSLADLPELDEVR
jgi:phosphoglycolate phosphatase